ncbi:hypothetical protein [Actinokineospora globicatena]|uniref:hypothetical protein n=1 Tax=Actinokineospora globicatena TaxID=103729 RepID=UPI0020A402CA|nr:hypothetical protein [Actinokineospora globicatena]GLW86727.1 hypothetical protein Aglo02_43660 [Actinokineospora globicatena]
MRLRMALVALLTMLATLSFVGSATATPAPRPESFSPATTGTGSFFAINGANQLVKWTRNATTYTSQLIGPGWGDSRLIAGLGTSQLIQIRYDGTLWDWKYNVTAGQWYGYYVSADWDNIAQLGGLGYNRFLVKTTAGVLREYVSAQDDHVYSLAVWTGASYGNQTLVTGLSASSFFGIDKDTGIANHYAWSGGVATGTYVGTGWGNVSKIAGIDATRFVTVRSTDNKLVEWNNSAGTWTSVVFGPGWDDAKLIG